MNKCTVIAWKPGRPQCSAGLCRRILFALGFRAGPTFTHGRCFSLLLDYRQHGFLNQSREICADTIGYPKHQLHGRIAQTSLHQTEHGFGHTRALAHCIIRKLSPFPLFSQQPNEFFSDCFIMSDSKHVAALQKKGLDTYFAIVKYYHLARQSARQVFCGLIGRTAHMRVKNDESDHTTHRRVEKGKCPSAGRDYWHVRVSSCRGGDQARHLEETLRPRRPGTLLSPFEMKPLSSLRLRERNNCHLDKRGGRDDKRCISGARSRAGGGRQKVFLRWLKDRVI
jgi:hypothetical protein